MRTALIRQLTSAIRMLPKQTTKIFIIHCYPIFSHAQRVLVSMRNILEHTYKYKCVLRKHKRVILEQQTMYISAMY